MRFSLILVILLLVFSAAQATTINVPADQSLIQSAIDVAADGDTILVADGVYTGAGNRNIRFLGKNIVLKSENGPEYTTLDCGSDSVQTYSGIILGGSQTQASVIDGFTFRGGATGTYNAAALGCHGASPTVRNCIFADNTGEVIIFENSTAVFENCSIVANRGTSNGTIRCFSSDPEFRNCLIAYNTGGPAVFFLGDTSVPDFSCSLIYGNEGGDWTDVIAGQDSMSGNLHLDPKLCDPTSQDYHLQPDSPCRSGASNCGPIGAVGVGCVDGVSPFADNLVVAPVDSNGHIFSDVPAFSWEFADTGVASQQGYIVQIVAAIDNTGDIFWADTVNQSGENSILYDGPPLNSHAIYYVRVKLFGEYGSGPWRETPFFTQLSKSFYVPVSQPTIQEAINVAFVGDTIIVKDGIYTGAGNRNISFRGKSLVLRSENGPAYTIIDAEGAYRTRVFTFLSREDTTSILDGFTITGGSLNADHNFSGGAGIDCLFSSPLIRNCIFTNNRTGSGVGCTKSSAILENCTFVDNSADTGSAIWSFESNITLRRCNIVFNGGGPAVAVQKTYTDQPITVECTNIYGNNAGAWDFPFQPVTDSATDALTFDPQHCAGDLDYGEVRATSLCLPANSPCGELIGAVDSVCLTSDVNAQTVSALPTGLELAQNYPNPFNPTTTIEYNLPRRAQVTIEIFNLLGRRVRTLVDREESAGSYTVLWNGKDAGGNTVATGIYLYRIQAGEHVATKKMLLLK